MKKNLFYVMAASLAFTACTDDFGYENNIAPDNGMVDVEDVNFMVSRGAEADSRAAWVEGENDNLSFRWTSADDAIGMAYVGSATGKLGVTNYKFVADRLKFDEKVVALKAADQINENKPVDMFYQIEEDGVYDITLGSGDYVNYTFAAANTEEDLTLGKSASAKFKTVNDQIMKGYYVTYYPFAEEYTEAGTLIPVSSPKRVEDVTVDNNLEIVGQNTFAYSKPAEVNAGAQVTEFSMKNLSLALRIVVTNEGNLDDAKDIKSVVLRTKGNDAFVVKGLLIDPTAAPSASNIAVDATNGKSSTLFLDYAEDEYPTLSAGKTKPTTTPAPESETLSVYFPVLPTTFNAGGIEVILIDEDNMACVLNANFKNAVTTLPAGVQASLYVTLTENDKFDQSFVTDAETLQSVINNARTQTSTTTINLLGDVVAENLNVVNNNNAEANRNWKGGLVINGSAGSTLTLINPSIKMWDNGDNPSDETFKCESLTINAPLVVNGGEISGRVIVDDVTFKGNVNLGGYYNTYGLYSFMKIAGDATVEKDAKLTVVYGRNYRPALYGFTGGLHIAEGASLTVKEGGELENQNLNFVDYTYRSDIVVDGTLTVDAKADFKNYGDTEVGATGKLIVNGTATNYNNIEVKGGTFEVAGTLNNETSASADNAGGVNKGEQAPKIMIPSGKLELKAEGVISNKYSLNCAGTFVNSGVFYDYVGSVYGGSPFSSNGKYACYVNSQSRLLEAVNRLNIYAADKYQEVILQSGGDYDLDDIAEDKAAKLNIVNDGDVTLKFEADNYTKAASMTFNSLTVKGDAKIVTISDNINFAGTTIAETAVAPISIADKATLKISNDITVKANGAIVNAGTFDLLNAVSTNNIPATVYCTSADVTTGKWTNYPIITASSNFWE